MNMGMNGTDQYPFMVSAEEKILPFSLDDFEMLSSTVGNIGFFAVSNGSTVKTFDRSPSSLCKALNRMVGCLPNKSSADLLPESGAFTKENSLLGVWRTVCASIFEHLASGILITKFDLFHHAIGIELTSSDDERHWKAFNDILNFALEMLKTLNEISFLESQNSPSEERERLMSACFYLNGRTATEDMRRARHNFGEWPNEDKKGLSSAIMATCASALRYYDAKSPYAFVCKRPFLCVELPLKGRDNEHRSSPLQPFLFFVDNLSEEWKNAIFQFERRTMASELNFDACLNDLKALSEKALDADEASDCLDNYMDCLLHHQFYVESPSLEMAVRLLNRLLEARKQAATEKLEACVQPSGAMNLDDVAKATFEYCCAHMSGMYVTRYTYSSHTTLDGDGIVFFDIDARRGLVRGIGQDDHGFSIWRANLIPRRFPLLLFEKKYVNRHGFTYFMRFCSIGMCGGWNATYIGGTSAVFCHERHFTPSSLEIVKKKREELLRMYRSA